MAKKPLERLAPEELIGLMDEADGRALRAVAVARRMLAKAAGSAAKSLKSGGRLIYLGAGTSGRLGVLDASECPPTFSASPGQVVGVMAGGMKALYSAAEGAEDNMGLGQEAVRKLRVGPHDMVVGITASGTTPFVLAGLSEAISRGADAWLLSCAAKKPAHAGVKVINLNTGREVIQGSTRLAAGTATKLALNRISTGAFVQMGKVYGDLMVDVVPSNVKLVKRAVGIITEIARCTEAEAAEALSESGGRPKVAALMLMRGIGCHAAEALLEENGGFLRDAIGEV
ncbi:MAG TPA: N-acetylmuramic acid 6-phosphate etherase [Nitrospirota bacterium]